LRGRVLLDRERRQAAPRLRSDHDASTAARDHIAEPLQDERGSVEIGPEDRFRSGLGWGNAGGMNEIGDLADTRGRRNQSLNRGA
jgi:hypothetical protein